MTTTHDLRTTVARTSAGAGAKTRRAKSVRVPDATAFLKKDHKDVKALFAQYGRLHDDAEKSELAAVICGMLKVHTQIEEEIFYPALREAGVAMSTMDEAQVEHASAKDLIDQIEGTEPGDDLYDAKIKVLGEYINHHVKEEEGDMFKKARAKKLNFVELGRELHERSKELKADLGFS